MLGLLLILLLLILLRVLLLIGLSENNPRRSRETEREGGKKKKTESMHVQRTNLRNHHKGRSPAAKVGGSQATVYPVFTIP